MRAFTEWWNEIGGSGGKWLILGKGPTFQRLDEFDIREFRLAALNHVVREMPVEISSIIDLEVIRDCGEYILANAKYLVMPRFPHLDMKAAGRPLESFFDDFPVLQKMNEQKRLIWYNLSSISCTEPILGAPIVDGISFNSEAVVSLFGQSGAKFIRTLGVDGGTNYAGSFNDLNEKTLLANGQPNFDVQFTGLAQSIRKYDLNFAPLTSSMPCNYYINEQEPGPFVTELINFSFSQSDPITSNISYESKNSSFIKLLNELSKSGTERLLIFQGSPILNTKLREVWELPFDGASILFSKALTNSNLTESALVLLNIDRVLNDINTSPASSGVTDYSLLQLLDWYKINKIDTLQNRIPANWQFRLEPDSNEGLFRCYNKLTGYPWLSPSAVHGSIWEQELRRAIDMRTIQWEDLEAAVQNGEARRSLLTQLALPREEWEIFKRSKAPLIDFYWRYIGKYKQKLTKS